MVRLRIADRHVRAICGSQDEPATTHNLTKSAVLSEPSDRGRAAVHPGVATNQLRPETADPDGSEFFRAM